MRATHLFRGFAVAGLFAFALAALSACAAPAPNGGSEAADAPASAGTAQPATPPPAPRKPMRTGGPLPPERVPDAGEVTLDYRCRTDADCTVKNVGNCCGYYPACVNVDSPANPQAVQAQCAREGMASVCGFREISACTCRQGRCEAAGGGPAQ